MMDGAGEVADRSIMRYAVLHHVADHKLRIWYRLDQLNLLYAVEFFQPVSARKVQRGPNDRLSDY